MYLHKKDSTYQKESMYIAKPDSKTEKTAKRWRELLINTEKELLALLQATPVRLE